MSRKASRRAASQPREQQPANPSRLAASHPQPARGRTLTPGRKWAARLGLMVLVPALSLGLLECGLKVFGYGYPTSFFVKTDDGQNYTANRSFGWQFFPRASSTYPHPFLMPAQ